ncbi:nucleolar complex-associated protein-domain-containing protein, partial [Gaertneriomyces semiglobifer]
MRKKSNWRKVKVPTPGKLAAHEVNEDIVLSDQDDAFFEEYGQFSSFLTRLNPDELARNEVLEGPRAIMRAKGTLRIADNDSEDDAGNDDSDAEATYEAKPRNIKAGWKENEKTRLPIKGQDGILRMQEVIVPDSSVMTPAEDEATDDSDDDDMAQEVVRDGKQSKVLPSASTIPDPVAVPDKRPRSKGGRLAEAQENLAAIASSIIEDPEKNIGMLKNLRQIGTEKDVQIKKFAFMTQLAVYKDIIPGYRIRQLTEAEKGVKVSKDVKKLRQYEEGLLSNYQAYLQVLESTVQTSLKAKQYDDPLIIIAMQCMADLLTSVTHFNFRLNLMTAIVTRSTVKNPPEVSVICCNALCTLFDNDESGEASLEAVKLLARTIKSKNYNVREEVLKSLLHLKLTHLSGGKDEAGGQQEHNSKKRKNDKDEKHKSRKMRKVEKMNKEVEQEMKEAEATYDKEEVDKRRTETLKFVFLTYFRILKNSPSSTLLPAVLEGLAKFAHLINVEFFADLLNVLKKISFEQYQKYLDGDNTSEEDARSAFHCVIAAFQLLSGQGEALNLDLKDFYTSMYTQLMRLPVNSEASIALAGTAAEARRRSGSELELALKGFELLFYKSRMIPVERVASFAKRLATVALHISANGALACLAMIRSLIIRFPRLESLLDAEGRIGTGIYQPLLNDPELTNPFATNLWEMSVFSRHYHPTVRTLA